MNRRQRRLQEKKAAKLSGQKKNVPAGVKSKAEQLKAEGMALKAAGQDREAADMLMEALKLDSSLADAHFALAMMARTKPGLGVDMAEANKCVKDSRALQKSYQNILLILRNRKQYDEAMVGQEELCRLMPDNDEEQVNFALLLAMSERKALASSVVARLMKKNPENKDYKALFVNICCFTKFMHFDPDVKVAIQRCFDNIYESNLLKLYLTWIALVRLDPEYPGIKDVESALSYGDFLTWIENAGTVSLEFFQSRFFLDGIRLLIIADPFMERFLAWMRRWLCLNARALEKEGRLGLFEPFLFALAEQCFFNEYVFEETKEEREAVDNFIKNISAGVLSKAGEVWMLALVGCYRPLFRIFPHKKSVLLEYAARSEGFASLAKTQFLDPEEEEGIKGSIESFGSFANKISKDVQSQYEENPYPRWVSVISFPILGDRLTGKEQARLKARSVLIAGCGTGRQVIDAAANYPEAKITAIDLSRASLAYAQRKASEAGVVHKVDFIHADILSMENWEGQFDVVECSGVMHHMEDPFKGWRILTDRLKSGGFFKVGLYSEVARKAYIEGQDFAKQHGFSSTLEGIRSFRRAIMELPTNNEMRRLVTGSSDFYTTSLVRDLIFHVQEHRMSLPQIKEMTDRLGLECVSFVISDVVSIKRYERQFPDDPDRCKIMNWHAIEQQYPLTFIGMYQFWCQKLN